MSTVWASSLGEGTWWVSGGAWFPPVTLSDGTANHDAACRELGAVVCRRGPRHLALQWDVDLVDEPSLEAAVRYAARFPEASVELLFHKQGWAKARCPGRGLEGQVTAIQRARGCSVAAATVSEQPFAAAENAEPLVQAVARGWVSVGRRQFAGFLAETRLGRHAVAFALARDGDELRYETVGDLSDFRWLYGPDCARAVIGLAPELTAGQQESRLSDGYRLALDRGEPVYFHGRANLTVGSKSHWVPFQRLVVPLETAVHSFAKITDDIDLPPFPGA